MNKLDKQYTDLLQDILDNGITKQDRTGTGTVSVFGRQIRHKMSEGFPLLTTKKMAWKTMVVELLWFLRGDTNVKFLVDNGCNIWNGDAYKNYLVKTKNQIEDPNDLNWDLSSPKDPKITQLTQEQFINKIKTDDEFAKKWGELGPIYGKQWRSCSTRKLMFRSDVVGEPQFLPEFFEVNSPIDQIENLINDLKTNPDSRRLMVSAWNVGELDQMVLPPCHYGFQVYTRELSDEEKWEQYSKSGLNIEINGIPLELKHMGTKFYPNSLPKRAISLMWNQRSVDTFLGLPFNIASYGLLLEIIAKEVNMIPDELIGNLGDVHLYSNHIEQAKEQIGREPFELPILRIASGPLDDIAHHEIMDFDILNYQSHPTIKAPLSN
ncbi:ThyA Thymidylate synthase [uncultured Caudovirales phage]|uniref:thymidylate synthase n=1 Tax=uncultured Caudovirales phage TaxID=2100421 RepID=A0A6J5LVU9_9CAUD|nr:ThyA Thymidylate synthase [uncultured Caudovirales phage]